MIDWNVPKHLARFDFKDSSDGSTDIKVFPHDTADNISEATSSATPFFQATVRPFRWAPWFPASANWLKYAGLDISLVQPPLPEGKGSENELPGTDQWCKVLPGQVSRRTCLAWVDMSQKDETGTLHAQYENFWPNLGRWQLGIKMENSEISFSEGTYWSAPVVKL